MANIKPKTIADKGINISKRYKKLNYNTQKFIINSINSKTKFVFIY